MSKLNLESIYPILKDMYNENFFLDKQEEVFQSKIIPNPNKKIILDSFSSLSEYFLNENQNNFEKDIATYSFVYPENKILDTIINFHVQGIKSNINELSLGPNSKIQEIIALQMLVLNWLLKVSLNGFDSNIQLKYIDKIDKLCFGQFVTNHKLLSHSNLAKLFYCLADLKLQRAKFSSNPHKDYNDCAIFCEYVLSLIDNYDDIIPQACILPSDKEHLNNIRDKTNFILKESYKSIIQISKIADSEIIDFEGQNEEITNLIFETRQEPSKFLRYIEKINRCTQEIDKALDLINLQIFQLNRKKHEISTEVLKENIEALKQLEGNYSELSKQVDDGYRGIFNLTSSSGYHDQREEFYEEDDITANRIQTAFNNLEAQLGDYNQSYQINTEQFATYDNLLNLLEARYLVLKEHNNEKCETEHSYFSDFVKNATIDYLKTIFELAEKLIGGSAPCKYTLMGLGSLATQQMTLYSDLEFCILTENDNYKSNSNPKMRNYFKNLSYLAHFVTICLRETVIPTSYYGIDLNQYTKQALCFDLGGKTPIGRLDGDKDYELIGTVDEIFKYFENKNDSIEHIDKNLPVILERYCYICGEQSLLDEYDVKVREFMASPSAENNQLTNRQYRAYKILKLHRIEIDYNSLDFKQKITDTNLNQFHSNLSDFSVGDIIDIKQQMYRMMDILIVQLGNIFNVTLCTHSDILQELYEEGILSKEGLENLKKALSFVTIIRNKTYNYYQSQKHGISIPEKHSGSYMAKATFQFTEDELKIGGSLFQFYYVIKPLYEWLLIYCCDVERKAPNLMKEIREGIAKEIFYDDDAIHDIKICKRLMKWKSIVKITGKYIIDRDSDSLEQNDEILIFSSYAMALDKLGKYNEALEISKEALFLCEAYSPENLELLFKVHYEISVSYMNLSEIQKALMHQETAYSLCLKLISENDSHENYFELANCCTNLVLIYSDLDNYQRAKYYATTAMGILKSLPERPDYIANCLWSISCMLFKCNNYEMALSFGLKSLESGKKIFSPDNPLIISVSMDIAVILNKLGRYSEAIEYIRQAKEFSKENMLYVSYNTDNSTLEDLSRDCKSNQCKRKRSDLINKESSFIHNGDLYLSIGQNTLPHKEFYLENNSPEKRTRIKDIENGNPSLIIVKEINPNNGDCKSLCGESDTDNISSAYSDYYFSCLS